MYKYPQLEPSFYTWWDEEKPGGYVLALTSRCMPSLTAIVASLPEITTIWWSRRLDKTSAMGGFSDAILLTVRFLVLSTSWVVSQRGRYISIPCVFKPLKSLWDSKRRVTLTNQEPSTFLRRLSHRLSTYSESFHWANEELRQLDSVILRTIRSKFHSCFEWNDPRFGDHQESEIKDDVI